MRITNLQVSRYRAKLPAPMRSRGAPGFTEFFHTGSERQEVELLAVETDGGVTGYGWLPGSWSGLVERVARPVLEGQWLTDQAEIALLRDNLFHGAEATGMSRRAVQFRVHAIEFALWDLLAKASELSVAHLWGAPEGPLVAEVYAGGGCLCWNPLSELLSEARAAVNAGHRRLKIKIGHGPEEDAAIVRSLRQAVGPEIELMVDANCAYDGESALRLCETLRACGVRWFEEPLPTGQRAEYRRLRSEGGVPIAGGEGFAELAELQIALAEEMLDVFQGDGLFFGPGLLFTAARLCYASGVRITPHACNSAAARAVGLHLQASIPDGAPQEWDTFGNPFLHEVFTARAEFADGQVTVGDTPGWGLDPDRAALEAYATR